MPQGRTSSPEHETARLAASMAAAGDLNAALAFVNSEVAAGACVGCLVACLLARMADELPICEHSHDPQPAPTQDGFDPYELPY